MTKSLQSVVETFGKRLQRLCAKKGLSSADLARAVEVTPTAVWNWENDNTQPRYLTLMRIAEVLGVSPEYMETGEEDAEVPTTRSSSVVALLEETRKLVARKLELSDSRIKLTIEIV